ncbi:hypothetical protein OKW96_00315 [Sphingobacterium sp. KU25419]|nr:hypothetical protein OKW96_00315 [Sphingobacterium sp. KU25419]
MNLRRLFYVFAIGLTPVLGYAQDHKSVPENWFNLDYEKDGVLGISTEKTYESLLKGKKSTPVIVAVLDGGVDVNHEDLKMSSGLMLRIVYLMVLIMTKMDSSMIDMDGILSVMPREKMYSLII